MLRGVNKPNRWNARGVLGRAAMAIGILGTLSLPSAALAKKKAKAGAAPTAEQKRSMAELGGKFKWGMSQEDVLKVMDDTTHARFKDLIANERDMNKADDLRKQELDDIQKSKNSFIKFDGKKGGWDVSIIDKEFQQRNDESMLVMWEKDQRRFLFFWKGKLYKQFIAFDAQHPVFKGKSFDDFVQIIAGRYGQPAMKFSQMKTKDDMVVDHLEWPAVGSYQLWAIDQSSFYGNFCLRVFDPKVQGELDKVHEARAPKRANGNALIDAVTKPDSVEGDRNVDVVDEMVTGKKNQRSNAGSAPGSDSDSSGQSGSTPKPDKKGKSDDKGLEL
jgi:hypothetical protein